MATEIVEALLEAVTERQEDEAAGRPANERRRGMETGLALAALLLDVQEAASPQRNTELPGWLATHGDLPDSLQQKLGAVPTYIEVDGVVVSPEQVHPND